MAHHHQKKPHVTRVFIACSPAYHNRRAIMEALASIFIDTIEEQREYYYFDCPAMTEIFDDGVFNRTNFRRLAADATAQDNPLGTVAFTYIVAGGDDAFVTQLLSDINASDAQLVRLT